MTKLIGTLAILAALIGGFGYYRGWFTVTTTDSNSGKTDISVHVDKTKIREDAHRAEEAAHKAVDAAGKKVDQLSTKSK